MANAIPQEILDSITYEIVGDVVETEPGVYLWEEKEHIWKDGQEYRVRHMRSPKMIAEILKPVLSPEEYERRRQKLEEACAKLFIAHERAIAKKAAEEVRKTEVST